jgi:hypothetical protein
VLNIAKAAAKAVATDRAILRRLLQLCLPADLFNSLDIEALIDAMIKSTVVEGEASGGEASTPPGSKAPPGAGGKTPPSGAGKTPPGSGSGGKTPPGAAAKSASIKVTQTFPGISASQVRARLRSCDELQSCLFAGICMIGSRLLPAKETRH